MTDHKPESNSSPSWMQPIESRREKANYYFNAVLSGQQCWYSEKAGQQKSRYLFLAIAVIILGALISVLQVFAGDVWVPGATALLGAAVAVLRSVDTLLRPNETWQAYRKASEGMKREYRLYLNNTEAYAQSEDEEAAYRLFVERVETVIAEEQKLFWQFHAARQAAVEAKERNR
ncbi:MAG: DUF4231 domain-containing protein [Gammaproteobacteria bacterium]